MTQYLHPNSILIFGRTLKREVLEGQGSWEAATRLVDHDQGQGARGGLLGGINAQPALITADRLDAGFAEFPSSAVVVAKHAEGEGDRLAGGGRRPEGRQVQSLATEDAQDVGLGQGAIDMLGRPQLYSVMASLVPG